MDILKLKDWLIDLVFPKECLGCGLPETYLCRSCFLKLEFNKKFYCVFCKRETLNSSVCQECQKTAALKAVFIVANYNDKLLQNLLHNLKYNYIEGISKILADLIIEYFRLNDLFASWKIDSGNSILTAVPLHKKRYLSRGFNQSALLARELNRYYQIPYIDLLKRKINTLSQVNLSRQERQANIADAFIYNNQLAAKDKKIIIIDDVVTTGSTLNECAKVLSTAGFKEIYGLVVAQRDD